VTINMIIGSVSEGVDKRLSTHRGIWTTQDARAQH
jgi:hypothetical protein